MSRLEDRLRRDLRAQAEHITPVSVPRLRLPGAAGRQARAPWHRGLRRRSAWLIPLAAAGSVTVMIIGTFIAIPLVTSAAPRVSHGAPAVASAASRVSHGASAAASAAPGGAARYVAIDGSGTSWPSIAIDQWAANLRPAGIVINFNPDGSAAGRADYASNKDDFTASDPPFRSGVDKLGGAGPEHPVQGYSYIPDVAGATAFAYHITVDGHRVTHLRLSASTLMEIFTGQITNWDSPQITRDNGHQLPSLPITPVINAEGDGGTYFFTNWMAHVFPSQWNAFCRRVHPSIKPPCGPTEFYPQFGNARAEPDSNNVIAYIGSTFGNGAIGYINDAYAINSRTPVAQVRNPAGRYVLPTAASITTALTRALINSDPRSPGFLQQDLTRLYTYTNPRSYPLASYSYLIVPRAGTTLPTHFTKAKGHTLRAFISYALCQGQRQLAALGYAPLPAALVRGGLHQAAHIPGRGPIPSPAQCGLTP